MRLDLSNMIIDLKGYSKGGIPLNVSGGEHQDLR